MFTDVKMDPVSNKREYVLEFNSDGRTSAKTPPMFIEEGEERMQNDANEFLQRVRSKLSNG